MILQGDVHISDGIIWYVAQEYRDGNVFQTLNSNERENIP